VSEFTLTAVPALGGHDENYDGTGLRELTDMAIVSLGLPLNGEAAARKAIATAFGATMPPVGNSVLSKDGLTRLARLGPDQLFAFFTNPSADAEQVIAARLNGTAYTTDQSDVWVALEISGPNARAALERICPLDLHPDIFATGNAARTVMEHLGTLILRIGPDKFMLLSASSSARSFLHALEVSIRNLH
jgi:methylglutamate dehydrogenase subunit D